MTYDPGKMLMDAMILNSIRNPNQPHDEGERLHTHGGKLGHHHAKARSDHFHPGADDSLFVHESDRALFDAGVERTPFLRMPVVKRVKVYTPWPRGIDWTYQ